MNKRKRLLKRINWNAQDVGVIWLRDKKIGNKLRITCAILWKELLDTDNPPSDLINRLNEFHYDVELSARRTGLYNE